MQHSGVQRAHSASTRIDVHLRRKSNWPRSTDTQLTVEGNPLASAFDRHVQVKGTPPFPYDQIECVSIRAKVVVYEGIAMPDLI